MRVTVPDGEILPFGPEEAVIVYVESVNVALRAAVRPEEEAVMVFAPG